MRSGKTFDSLYYISTIFFVFIIDVFCKCQKVSMNIAKKRYKGSTWVDVHFDKTTRTTYHGIISRSIGSPTT